jgi:hypothetical protein
MFVPSEKYVSSVLSMYQRLLWSIQDFSTAEKNSIGFSRQAETILFPGFKNKVSQTLAKQLLSGRSFQEVRLSTNPRSLKTDDEFVVLLDDWKIIEKAVEVSSVPGEISTTFALSLEMSRGWLKKLDAKDTL